MRLALSLQPYKMRLSGDRSRLLRVQMQFCTCETGKGILRRGFLKILTEVQNRKRCSSPYIKTALAINSKEISVVEAWEVTEIACETPPSLYLLWNGVVSAAA